MGKLLRGDLPLVWHLLVLLYSLQRNPIFLRDQPALYLLPADQSLRSSLAGEVWDEKMGRVAGLQEIFGGCSCPHSFHQDLEPAVRNILGICDCIVILSSIRLY